VNLAEALGAPGATAPDRPALRTAGGGVVTHGELASRAAAAAVAVGGGAGPDDRVALVAGNEAAFVVAYLAVLATGAVAVPLNPSAPSHELARELAVVDPALVVASPARADVARRALSRAEVGARALVLDDDARAPRGARPEVGRSPGDLAVLLFTAGTAGAPKPAMLTHGSLLANIEQMQAHPGLRLRDHDVVLGALPFFHVFGLNVVLGLALHAGASLALVEHFHPAETLERMATDGVTVVAAVPAMLAAWLAAADADPAVAAAARDAFARVRLCVSGAAALPAGVAEAVRARWGVAVHEGYGLTEASPVVTTSAVEAEPRPGSIGPPLPGVEVRLVDRDGAEVLEGDPGELLVRGPNVFAGYWGDDEATARVLDSDGWLHTGDVAVADADGWLTLVERAKDVVIVSGFNVYPGEVEDALADHPDVDEVAVVGEPHPRTGETVVAYVVARAGARVDPVGLLRHAGRRLARYKLPTRVEIVDELPRSFAGKLLRRALAGERDATANPA
jgi:long-chain acyl-CoA synthetase